MQKGLVRHRLLFEDFQTPNACGQRVGRPCLGTKPLPRPLIQGSDEGWLSLGSRPRCRPHVYSEESPRRRKGQTQSGKDKRADCKEPSRMQFAPGRSLPPTAHPSGTAGGGRGWPQTCACGLLTSAPGRGCGVARACGACRNLGFTDRTPSSERAREWPGVTQQQPRCLGVSDAHISRQIQAGE